MPAVALSRPRGVLELTRLGSQSFISPTKGLFPGVAFSSFKEGVLGRIMASSVAKHFPDVEGVTGHGLQKVVKENFWNWQKRCS